ncbi:ribosome maturation factor RimM [Alphaproteobacteria bacterium]|nr:ribosome maturation factor RimM [Alphaproteobacteria bacterium]
MNMSKKKICLGKIISAHGVKGLFNVDFYNEDSVSLEKYLRKVYLDDQIVRLKRKFKKGRLSVCQYEGINSKEEVIEIIGKEIWIEESDLPRKSSNEYFHLELIECKVYDKNNKFIGKVSAIHNFGAGDLLELSGKFKYMIRFYDLKKEDIDLKNKRIRLSENYEI